MVVRVVGLPAPEEGQSVIGGVGVGGDVVVVAVVAAALRRKALAADSAVKLESSEFRKQCLFTQPSLSLLSHAFTTTSNSPVLTPKSLSLTIPISKPVRPPWVRSVGRGSHGVVGGAIVGGGG